MWTFEVLLPPLSSVLGLPQRLQSEPFEGTLRPPAPARRDGPTLQPVLLHLL